MTPMARALRRAGFDVLNWGYASRRATVPEFGERLAKALAGVEGGRAAPAGALRPIHFVGHSLGNIVIRWVIANDPPARLGRVVMLAPPNQGSRLADLWAPWLSWFLRPLAELTSDPASTARSIPTPHGVEIGIVAGAQDFKTPPPRTVLAGQADHVVVRAGHTFLMARPTVQVLTVRFLRTGAFSEGGADLGYPADR